jgi:hypothetical protein
MLRHLILCLPLLLGSCGGRGGGSVEFLVAGSTPRSGDIEVPVDTAVVVAMTLPVDPATVDASTFRLEEGSGAAVLATILVDPVTPAVLRLVPRFPLEQNSIYRCVLASGIASEEGAPLGTAEEFTFITASPTPTVRPDQVEDLGDLLQVPRHLARAIRLPSGLTLVCGGVTSGGAVTDTAEIYDPATGRFRLLSGRMNSPRVEHSVALLADGNVLVTGGVAAVGGPPLASAEMFHPAQEAFGAIAPMGFARRGHASSELVAGGVALVTGGFGDDGAARSDGEILAGNGWTPAPGGFGEGIAQHVQLTRGSDRVYVGVGNVVATGGWFDGISLSPRLEGDSRRRGAVVPVDPERALVVAGDTRSIVIFDFGLQRSYLATDLLFDRRGEHSLTPRGDRTNLFLAAGGFNIAIAGAPALDSLEVIEYFPVNASGFPDAVAYLVQNVRLPAPMAGHVAIEAAGGATLLAGGVSAPGGAPSRRAVLIRVD